jgi:hypothetical protein
MTSHSFDDRPTVMLEANDRASLAAPEESFWQRYSAHQELPLSLSSSGVAHAIVIALLLLGGIMAARWHERPEISIVAVQIEGDGSGRPHAGAGPAPGSNPSEALPQNPAPTEPKTEPAPLAPLKPDAVVPPPLVGPEKERPVEQGLRNRLEDVSNAASRKLRPGLPAPGAESHGGTPGNDQGRPGGKLSIHQQRLLRWVMVFNIRQPEDYAHQLQDLKAILAIPIAGKDKEFLVIEDLSKRPAQPKAKDVTQIDRIYWRDDRPESVASLARVLGIAPAPAYFVAFFPEELEKKLLDRELAYARGKREEMIEETRFEIRSTAKGYEPFVVDQRFRESKRK